MATAALRYYVDRARIWRLIELYNKYMARYLIGGQGGESDQMIYSAARSGNTASTFVVAAHSTAEPLIYLFFYPGYNTRRGSRSSTGFNMTHYKLLLYNY